MKKVLILSLTVLSLFMLTGCGSKKEEISEENNTNTNKDELAIGKLVFFDPVSSNECNKSTFNLEKIKLDESTCYKWRVLKIENDDITIQLDHNLIETIAWNSTNKSYEGPITILSGLSSFTSKWNNVKPLNYTYITETGKKFTDGNYGKLECIDGTCTVNNNTIENVKARLITREEYNEIITDKDTSWLYENTSEVNESRANKNIYGNDVIGYWTLTPYGLNQAAWYISRYGSIQSIEPNLSTAFGARPVITISKSKLNY